MDGVFIPYDKDGKGSVRFGFLVLISLEMASIISVDEFEKDYARMNNIINSGPVKTFTYSRCKLLHSIFTSHQLLNLTRESEATQVRLTTWYISFVCLLSGRSSRFR